MKFQKQKIINTESKKDGKLRTQRIINIENKKTENNKH